VTKVATAEPFPSYDEELELAHDVSPAWMGIRFKPRESDGGKHDGALDGPVTVMTVYPDSPAKAAGLKVGDLVLGPPGKPFVSILITRTDTSS
jgi:S1-C subfamily serine protease